MNKKLGIGLAVAAITGGLVYLMNKKKNSRKLNTPEETKTRHRTDVFAKAKAQPTPLAQENPL